MQPSNSAQVTKSLALRDPLVDGLRTNILNLTRAKDALRLPCQERVGDGGVRLRLRARPEELPPFIARLGSSG